VNILTFAYRGFSESEGKPDETGLKQDGLDIMKYIKDNRDQLVGPNGHIFLIGRSLGGAVAAYVATHPETPKGLFSGLVLENTFTSISDMVDTMFFPPITTFKHHVLTLEWKTIDLCPAISLPVLFVTGDEDEIVPTKMTYQLYAASTNAPIRLMLDIAGGTHNDTWIHGYKKYMQKLKYFFKEASKFKSDHSAKKETEYSDGKTETHFV
jgi:fermentation-respiration switch protein FrsA (DUF1100 family)